MNGVGGNRFRAAAFAAALVALWFVSGPPAAVAAEPLALRAIMSDLGKGMQAIVDGLAREEYATVGDAARAIADHPQPPAPEKIRIIGFVGSRVAQFKAHDEATHDAAMQIADAANRQDAATVIDAFGKLQTACHGCHLEFRQPFLQHFYGAK